MSEDATIRQVFPKSRLSGLFWGIFKINKNSLNTAVKYLQSIFLFSYFLICYLFFVIRLHFLISLF